MQIDKHKGFVFSVANFVARMCRTNFQFQIFIYIFIGWFVLKLMMYLYVANSKLGCNGVCRWVIMEMDHMSECHLFNTYFHGRNNCSLH